MQWNRDKVPDLRPRSARIWGVIGKVLLVVVAVLVTIAAITLNVYREWRIWSR